MINSQALTFAWMLPGSYLLGSLPFSVWLGRLLLNKDIRRFGDHNPGAANVFRAGSPVLGMIVVLLDIGKGVPFVLLAKWLGLNLTAAVAIGAAAILGHCFSPWLHFRGGKGVAVTYGVLIGLWQPGWLFPFCAAAVVGLLLWENNAWVMLLTPAETLVFLLLTRAGVLPIAFMICVQVLFVFKFSSDVEGPPRLHAALRNRLTLRRQG